MELALNPRTPTRRLVFLMLCLLACGAVLADRRASTPPREPVRPAATATATRSVENAAIEQRIRELEYLEQFMDAIRAGIAAQEKHIEMLERQPSDRADKWHLGDLPLRLADLETELPRYEKELSDLEAEATVLKTQIDAEKVSPEQKEQLAKLTARIERKSLECDTLSFERDTLKKAIESRKTAASDVERMRVEWMRKALQQDRETLASIEKKLAELRGAPAP